MHTYRIIFTDLDGTLLTSQHRPSERTIQKARALTAQGVPFVLVSGRLPNAARPVQRVLGIRSPIISHGGAMTLDADGNVLENITTPNELLLQVVYAVRERWPNLCCCLQSGSNWFSSIPDDPHVLMESNACHCVMEPDEPYILPKAASIEALLRSDMVFNKFFTLTPRDESFEIERVLAPLFPMLLVRRSSDHHLDFMDKTACKERAMAKLCELYGITLDDAVSFGDNSNDIGMLRAAGLGVAMANASDEVKNAADCITLSNDEDGVVHMLDSLRFSAP